MFNDVWIGLAEVTPQPGVEALEEGLAGAHVQVLGRAKDAAAFHDLVKEDMDAMGFDLAALEDVELFNDRRRRRSYEADDRILQAAREVDAGRSTAFGTFFTYPAEE